MYFVDVKEKKNLTLLKKVRQSLFRGTTNNRLYSSKERLNSILNTIGTSGGL